MITALASLQLIALVILILAMMFGGLVVNVTPDISKRKKRVKSTKKRNKDYEKVLKSRCN